MTEYLRKLLFFNYKNFNIKHMKFSFVATLAALSLDETQAAGCPRNLDTMSTFEVS